MGATGHQITVALTSIPPRFDTLAVRLGAILNQRPARLCLTIPDTYRRFPGWDGRLPDLPDGVTLLRGADHGPASKFTTVFAAHPDADVLIADDDCDYGPGWLAAFAAARTAHPKAAIAASCFDSARLGLPAGHVLVQGFAGVMFRPDWLGPDLPCPAPPDCWVDDIWLSAQLARAGVAIRPCQAARTQVSAGPAPASLQNAQIGGKGRAELNRLVAQRLKTDLGVWRASG